MAYIELLSVHADSESFVRQSLALLEADFRKTALLALSDWSQLELVSAEMFQAVASLQRPSWGTWNGLLSALKNVRKNQLRNAGDEERQLIDRAELLQAILQKLEARVNEGLGNELRALSELARTPISRKLRLGAVLTLPISLRNRIAHDAPTSEDWWNDTAAAIRPLIEYHAQQSPLSELLADKTRYVSPWFRVNNDGVLCTFNGLTNDMAVVYVSSNGETEYSTEHSANVIRAFQLLLGKTESQEADFRKLLSKLAPEDIKGVMIGDYLVGKPIGSGGFATVHISRQLSTGRKVAVKLLNDGQSESVEERFQQEARFLSMFDNPHIVSVYGYGQEAWQAPRQISLASEEWFKSFSRSAPVKSFIAMEWIAGGTLEEVFARPEEDQPQIRQVAKWFSQAADALSTVHQAGLVHRDIKPSNLMVDEGGIIKLMDFGIARHQGEHRTLQTTTGKAIGTPAYLSPEQIRNSSDVDEVGPPTDVYSICATFYELSTGARVYDHDTSTLEMVTTKKIRGDRVARPRTKRSGLPWELDTILMGGLEPDAKDRYQSMDDLKRDVDHFLRDEPIEYRRPHVARRIQLAFRRNRTVATLLTTLFLGLILAAIGSTYAAFIYSDMANTELTLRNEMSERLYRAQMNLADDVLSDPQLQQSSGDILVRWYPGHPRYATLVPDTKRDLRGWEWYFLFGVVHRNRMPLAGRTLAVDVSKESLMGFGFANNLSVIRFGQKSGGASLNAHDSDITALRFSPNGKLVATAGLEGAVAIWNVQPRRKIGKLEHGAVVQSLSFNEAGDRLVTHADDAKLRIWDLETKSIVNVIQDSVCGTPACSVSPNGKLIAAGAEVAETFPIKLWDIDTGDELITLFDDAHTQPIQSIAWSPDGKRIVSGSMDRTVRVWDCQKHELAFTVARHHQPVYAVAWSPDGKTIASAGDDMEIYLSDSSTGEQVSVFGHVGGESATVRSLAWDPHSKKLVAALEHGRIETIDLGKRRAIQSFRIEPADLESPVASLHWKPNCSELSISYGTRTMIWSDDTADPRFEPATHTCWSHDEGHRAAVRGSKLVVWKGDDIVLVSQLEQLPHHIEWNPQQNTLAIQLDYAVHVWREASAGDSLESWVALDPMKHGQIDAITWSADGTKLVVGSRLGDIHIYHLEGSERNLGMRLGQKDYQSVRVRAIDWKPNSSLFAIGTSNNFIHIFDYSATPGKVGEAFQNRAFPAHDAQVCSLSWSPNGERLASASADRTVRVWNLDVDRLEDIAKKRVLMIPHASEVLDVAWSSDGRRLASVTDRGTVTVFDATHGYKRAKYLETNPKDIDFRVE